MFARFNRKQTAQTASIAVDEDDLAQIIESRAPFSNFVHLPQTRFGRALGSLIRDQNAANLDHLGLIADLAGQVSETSVNAIWMAHNLREMTEASRTISGAV